VQISRIPGIAAFTAQGRCGFFIVILILFLHIDHAMIHSIIILKTNNASNLQGFSLPKSESLHLLISGIFIFEK